MTSALRVVKLGANIGARIEGIDLSADVDPVSASKINAALLEHKVIFFRDQHDSTTTVNWPWRPGWARRRPRIRR